MSKTQNVLYALGGLLLLVGAVLPLLAPSFAPWVFAAGALLFSPMQMLARYDGRNLTVRRLRRQQLMGALLILVSAGLMFVDIYGPWRVGALWITNGDWKIFLLIAAVIEVYTAFRLPAADKE